MKSSIEAPAVSEKPSREQFASRVGFLFAAAGCAIGLGNIWRFPYITGQYGGAAFVVIYLVFLLVFSLPILIFEFTCGRGSHKGIARSFDVLEPKGTKWHWAKWLGLVGSYLLMMFYAAVAGWMLDYTVKSATGAFEGIGAEGVEAVFGTMLSNPGEMIVCLAVVVVFGAIVTSFGLQKGIERVSKVLMSLLFVLLIVLCVRAVTLPGASEGLSFYLMPDFGKLFANGPEGFTDAVFAAMGQAFFTLGVGVGSMSVFGSYMSPERSITGESVRIAGLDTLVALMAGLIIFPTCFTFGVEPGSGPGLVFITLPAVFQQMWMGRLWSTLFFLFMSFAALSTIVTVFENIMAFSIDQWGVSRKKACAINGVLIFALGLPCILGYNVWSAFQVPGIGDIQSLEDFILSNNILSIGALVFLLFCTTKRGWGWKAFLAEVDKGDGMKFPAWARVYVSYVLPVLIVIVWVGGWIPSSAPGWEWHRARTWCPRDQLDTVSGRLICTGGPPFLCLVDMLTVKSTACRHLASNGLKNITFVRQNREKNVVFLNLWLAKHGHQKPGSHSCTSSPAPPVIRYRSQAVTSPRAS